MTPYFYGFFQGSYAAEYIIYFMALFSLAGLLL